MHVVVVGGGFGGVKAALEMSKRQVGKVTLISDEPYFLHHSTLYSTATGKNYAESIIPLNVIFENHPNIEIIQDSITTFDPRHNLVGSNKKDYHYDKLILALGSVTTRTGVPGLKRHAFDTRSLDDIKEFQDHIHEEVVRQKLDNQYFIIGAGQTGVEVAGALNIYLKMLKNLYKLKTSGSVVALVESNERILPRLSLTASRKTAKELVKQGVSLMVGQTVESLNDDTITINDKKYPTTTAIWTSGTANNPFFGRFKDFFRLNNDGRVEVNPYLEALDDVYVIGDNNALKYSYAALHAMRQAKHAVKNITRIATDRKQVKYHQKQTPIGIPIGENWGYIEWRGIYISGWLGAVIRRLMELYGYCQLMPFKTALPIWRSRNLRQVDDDF